VSTRVAASTGPALALVAGLVMCMMARRRGARAAETARCEPMHASLLRTCLMRALAGGD
jgi:hypothetical protein